jgi:hypothetical protein
VAYCQASLFAAEVVFMVMVIVRLFVDFYFKKHLQFLLSVKRTDIQNSRASSEFCHDAESVNLCYYPSH